MKKKMIGWLLMGSFLGAGGKFKAGENNVIKTKEKGPSSHFLEILEDRFITKKTFVSHVQVGDKIYFKVKGWKIRTQFFTHTRTELAYRTINHCEGESLDSCYPKQHSFSCKMVYQKKEGPLKEDILLKDDFLSYPLRLLIGGKARLFNLRYRKGNLFEGELEISEEMLKEGNELYLEVVNKTYRSRKVGFVRFKDCEGWDKPNFRTHAPTKFHMANNFEIHQFLVSLTLETD